MILLLLLDNQGLPHSLKPPGMINFENIQKFFEKSVLDGRGFPSSVRKINSPVAAPLSALQNTLNNNVTPLNSSVNSRVKRFLFSTNAGAEAKDMADNADFAHNFVSTYLADKPLSTYLTNYLIGLGTSDKTF